MAMKYLDKTFSLATASKPLTQQQWDYAVLSKAEYERKYGPNNQ